MPGTCSMHLKAAVGEATPVVAGGLSAATLAIVDWSSLTANATAALLLAGTVGAGIMAGIQKFDQMRIRRKQMYDDHNKVSLSAQVEELRAQAAASAQSQLENQQHMRDSLHALRGEAQASKAEAHESRQDLNTLRQQFMAVSRQLHETDLALHAAHVELRTTNAKLMEAIAALAATEQDRQALRAEIEAVRKRSRAHGSRLKKLETGGSGEVATATERNTEATDRNTEALGQGAGGPPPPPLPPLPPPPPEPGPHPTSA